MIPLDFIKKIRAIEIRTKKMVNTIFAGEYKSVFKGTGVEFSDVREYLPGDDVRSIDWKVTARMGRPFVKKFSEERELTVILCVDASGSCHFCSYNYLKIDLAAQIAATLAFSAVKNNDKVGLLFFTDRIERYVPAKKGRFHVLRLIRDILYFNPRGRGTDPVLAFEFLMHILKHRAIIFFISDFIGEKFAPDYIRRPLGIVARKHDLIVITITDPMEYELPKIGLIEFEDLETAALLTVNTAEPGLLKRYQEHKQKIVEERERLLNSLGIDRIELQTREDFVPELHKFFDVRARRFR